MSINSCASSLCLVSGVVSAVPCDQALTGFQAAVAANNAALAAFFQSTHPECFGGGSTTTQVQINGTSFQQVSAISSAIGFRFSSNNPGPRASLDIKGMAAGSAGKKWNIWANAEKNDVRQRYRADNGFTTSNDSQVLNTVIGVDYSLSPTMIFGVSAAIDRGDTTVINASPGDVTKSIDSDGYAIAPYFGMQINKAFSFDASLGMGKGKFSSSNATAGKSDRWFGAINLNYERWMGNLQFSGKAGYLRGVEDYENLTLRGAVVNNSAAKNTLGQLRLTGQLGYWVNGFMPYASLGWSSDVERSTTQFGAPNNPIGKNAWVWSLGVNYIALKSGITAGIAYRQEESRSNQQFNSLMANIGIRF